MASDVIYWPALDVALQHLAIPPGVRLRQLGRADVDRLVGELSAWDPALAVSQGAALFSRDFYLSEVALAGESHAVDERSILVVLTEQGSDLVGCLLLELEELHRVLTVRMGAVTPTAARQGHATLQAQTLVAVAKAMGAELAYGWAELEHHESRTALESAGFVLSGLRPAFRRKLMPDGSIKYGPMALYVQPLVAAEVQLWPVAQNLTPRAAALLRLLFDRDVGSAVPTRPASPSPLSAGAHTPAGLVVTPRAAGCWPQVRLLPGSPACPPGVVLRQLRRGEIVQYCQQLDAWYPELADGSCALLLHPSYCQEEVALEGETQDLSKKPQMVWVLESAGTLIGITAISYVSERAMLADLVYAIDPAWRGQGLAKLLSSIITPAGQAMGVQQISCHATFRHSGSQWIQERFCGPLLGLVPASDRYRLDGRVVYGFDALYALSLVPEDQCYWPPVSSLPPRLAALVMFVRDQMTSFNLLS